MIEANYQDVNIYNYYRKLIFKNMKKERGVSFEDFSTRVSELTIIVMQKLNKREKKGQWADDYISIKHHCHDK
ncbi:MAG: hypothetical protein ACYC97_09750 [Metallibacterium sp.]